MLLIEKKNIIFLNCAVSLEKKIYSILTLSTQVFFTEPLDINLTTVDAGGKTVMDKQSLHWEQKSAPSRFMLQTAELSASAYE